MYVWRVRTSSDHICLFLHSIEINIIWDRLCMGVSVHTLIIYVWFHFPSFKRTPFSMELIQWFKWLYIDGVYNLYSNNVVKQKTEFAIDLRAIYNVRNSCIRFGETSFESVLTICPSPSPHHSTLTILLP